MKILNIFLLSALVCTSSVSAISDRTQYCLGITGGSLLTAATALWTGSFVYNGKGEDAKIAAGLFLCSYLATKGNIRAYKKSASLSKLENPALVEKQATC